MLVLFLISCLASSLVLAALLLRIALPQSSYSYVGALTDFPPAQSPYRLAIDKHVFFLVNDGEKLLALDRLYRAPAGHLVVWRTTPYQQFIDPGRGTRFDLYGINTISFTAADHPLARYPLQLKEGAIWINLDYSTPEPLELTLP